MCTLSYTSQSFILRTSPRNFLSVNNYNHYMVLTHPSLFSPPLPLLPNSLTSSPSLPLSPPPSSPPLPSPPPSLPSPPLPSPPLSSPFPPFLLPSLSSPSFLPSPLFLPLHPLTRLGDYLGSGQFGTVFSGEWNSGGRKIEVAVKTLSANPHIDDKVMFLQEAVIMCQFRHKNVIKMHGLVTDEEPVCKYYFLNG